MILKITIHYHKLHFPVLPSLGYQIFLFHIYISRVVASQGPLTPQHVANDKKKGIHSFQILIIKAPA
jgi:hypothetical protein